VLHVDYKIVHGIRKLLCVCLSSLTSLGPTWGRLSNDSLHSYYFSPIFIKFGMVIPL